MKSFLVFATFILTISMTLADDTFIWHAPTDTKGTAYVDIECRWVGKTSWLGYCDPKSCPDSTLIPYTEMVKSNGWVSFEEFFVRRFGTVSHEEDVMYKNNDSMYTNFGVPCIFGGQKSLCCKSLTFAGLLSFGKKSCYTRNRRRSSSTCPSSLIWIF